MPRRGRPRNITHTLDELLQGLMERNTDGEFLFATYKTVYQKKLFEEFWHYFTFDPVLLRNKLSMPPEYDRGHGAFTPRNPSYRFLPPRFIYLWTQRDDNWRIEPIIQYHIEKWRSTLIALRGSPEGKKIRDQLKRIDKTLIPSEAKGAGKFGTDKETCELYNDWCRRIHELNVQFKALQGSPSRADLDRKERLAQLFDLILDVSNNWRESGEWVMDLIGALGIGDEDTSVEEETLILRERKDEAIAYLESLIPLKGQTTAAGLAVDIVAFCSGRDVGSVKNAIKREKHRSKQDKM